MRIEVAKAIINSYINLNVKEITVSQVDDMYVNEYDNLNVHKIVTKHNLPMLSKLIMLDMGVNNQDNEINQAEYLLENFDDNKDIYLVTVDFENDIFGNAQKYVYLLQ